MQRIGVLYNPLSEVSIRVSSELTEWLEKRGMDVWRGVSHEGREEPSIVECMDLLIALGGDGTVLRATRLSLSATRCTVPVLPVALGHLSFMAELQPEELYKGLEILLNGGGWRDERTLVEATIYHTNGQTQHMTALNEILVARGEINRVVIIDIELYHAKLTTYHADGVLVATATGSTAYALAVGGPIIDPRSHALVVVPVAAHLTNIPSLVLDEDAVVRLRLSSRHPAAFSADGRDAVSLHEGDVVEVRRAEKKCIFARVHPPSTFYARLTQRLRR